MLVKVISKPGASSFPTDLRRMCLLQVAGLLGMATPTELRALGQAPRLLAPPLLLGLPGTLGTFLCSLTPGLHR